MNELVSGWLVGEDGELEEVQLIPTNNSEVFIRRVASLFVYNTEYYLLNKDFFTDKAVALERAVYKSRSEINRIAQQIEAYQLEMKELERAVRG